MTNSYHSWRTGIQIDNFYPVGSIYISVNATNPGSLFGGNWEQIQDTFLLAAGNTYIADDNNGVATHNHTHSHTHTTNATTTGGTSLQIGHLPSHNHGQASLSGWANFRDLNISDHNPFMGCSGIVSRSTESWSGTHAAFSSTNISGYLINKLNINATHTHTSQGSGTAHSHSQVATTSNTPNDSNTNIVNNMPPYLVVYVWERIS